MPAPQPHPHLSTRSSRALESDKGRDHADQQAAERDRARLARYLAGDPSGLAELVAAHQLRLLRLARLLSQGRVDAPAVVQEVWIAVIRRADTFRGEAPVHQWLAKITERAVFTALRRTRTHLELPDPGGRDAPVAPDHPELDAARRADLAVAFAGLSAEHREVLWLLYATGRPVEEVATRLGLNPNTLKSRARRARDALRARLDPDATDGPECAPDHEDPEGAGRPQTFGEALALLPEQQQIAARFLKIDQLTVAEVADRTGKTPAAVRALWRRGRAGIARRLHPPRPAAPRAPRPGHSAEFGASGNRIAAR